MIYYYIFRLFIHIFIFEIIFFKSSLWHVYTLTSKMITLHNPLLDRLTPWHLDKPINPLTKQFCCTPDMRRLSLVWCLKVYFWVNNQNMDTYIIYTIHHINYTRIHTHMYVCTNSSQVHHTFANTICLQSVYDIDTLLWYCFRWCRINRPWISQGPKRVRKYFGGV